MDNSNKAQCFWVTGLPGAGKSYFSEKLGGAILEVLQINPIILDGDEIREVLGKANSNFDTASRKELSHTYSKLCRLFTQQGHIVICATVSMFDDVRSWNRRNISGYFEVFLETPYQQLVERDQKGLFSSGILDPDVLEQHFQLPKSPDLVIADAASQDLSELVDKIVESKINVSTF